MSPFFEIGQAVTFLFFFFFLVIFPLIGVMEKLVYHLYLNKNLHKENRLSSHVYNNYIQVSVILNKIKTNL